MQMQWKREVRLAVHSHLLLTRMSQNQCPLDKTNRIRKIVVLFLIILKILVKSSIQQDYAFL